MGTAFLKEMHKSTSTWLQDGKVDIDYLPPMHFVYSEENKAGKYDELIDEIEGQFLRNATSMPAGSAARMISQGGEIRDPEVIEVCEKLIAHGLSDMYL